MSHPKPSECNHYIRILEACLFDVRVSGILVTQRGHAIGEVNPNTKNNPVRRIAAALPGVIGLLKEAANRPSIKKHTNNQKKTLLAPLDPASPLQDTASDDLEALVQDLEGTP